ncbi:MAG: type II toxin-antitoxin system VapC family toxin [Verrucomicrobiales bacterium]|nr:type II toxin-antitoxin system VapC family toxin [Verrucomicrobiales bacterium]
MKFLLDSNVLSEPTKAQASADVLNWLGCHWGDCVTSVLVMAEIGRGIDNLSEGKKKASLDAWFRNLKESMPSLPWDLETAVAWGGMVNAIKRQGYTVGIIDTMIAATARTHGLTVATRNTDDFARCGVRVVNPFESTHS